MEATMQRHSLQVWLAYLLLTAVSFGQDTVGSRIFGTVTDPKGMAVPNATIKITSPQTGFSRTVQPGPDGTYVAPQILAGTYELEVSLSGFKTVRLSGITVRVNENVRQDVQLELGEVTTIV